MPTRWIASLGFLVALTPCSGPRADAQPPNVEKPFPAARLAGAAEIRKRLGLVPEFDGVAGIDQLKVAVLDYGFAGMEGGKQYLPTNAVVVEHYDSEFVRRFRLGDPNYRKGFDPLNSHGRTMAQIIWAVTGFHAHGPRFFLLNANGPTMLRRAVRYAIEAKVDIILFSGTFEGGGNGDGRGPINRIVAEALSAGILWINAAGNYGGRVYNGSVQVGPDGYLRFGQGKEYLRFRNRLDENTVTVTLTWNDYHEEEDAGTDKDLDLYVEDWRGRQIGAGTKTQVSGSRMAGPAETRNPRERAVLADLPAALDRDYRIRIRARKGSFTSFDRIRVLITCSRETYVDPLTGASSDAIQFLDASGASEIYPPADNPRVLTVGDTSPASSKGPTADFRVKPDILLDDSRAVFSNGEVSVGASNAAAYFAGVVALMKVAEPKLATRHLLWFAHYGPNPRPLPNAHRANPVVQAAVPNLLRPALVRRSAVRYAERVPPPSRADVVPSTQSTAGSRRLWQTPTRRQLAQEVRSDR
jgi:hypothetical protein